MPLTPKPKPWVLLALSLFCLELASLACVHLLGLDGLVLPHVILLAFRHHFYLEASLSAAAGLLLLGLATLFLYGGVLRSVALMLALSLLCLFLCLTAGLAATLWFAGLPWEGFAALLQEMADSDLLLKHLLLGELLSIGTLLVLSTAFLIDQSRPERRALGQARFAHGFNLAKAGFFKQETGAILIGKKAGVPLFANGFEHVLVFAAAGSGKTRSIGMPNLFQYPWSVVCNDVKLSLFQTTSGYREKVLGHRCFCFAPAMTTTHRYNPLSFISADKLARMTDIQRIAHILIPDNKKDLPFWTQTARSLFKCLVLYLLDTEGATVTLGEINRLVKQASFDNWLYKLLLTTEHYDDEFYRNGFAYIGNHDKTRSNIKVSFASHFELFDDPVVDAATSGSDFDIRSLRREKITLYIGFSDDDLERLSPLLTLLWQQLISVMIQRLPDLKEEPYPVLFLLDEFSSLGRIERLRRSLKLLREYRVRCILMLQYIAQTYEQYTEAEAKAFTNIKTKIAYGAEDIQDAEYLSRLLGMRTRKIKAGSFSQQAQGLSQSQSYQWQATPLMRPEQIMSMREGKALILRTGMKPVKAGQYIWYKEAAMKKLALSPTPLPTQTPTLSPFDHTAKPLLEEEEEENPVKDRRKEKPRITPMPEGRPLNLM